MEDDFDNWLAERGKEAPEDDGRLLPGTVVGDCRIVALLGHGGFADVYRASGNNGESVAIKILHKLDDKSRARFVRESEILSQIKHRNIPRLLSFGSCGDRPYMVTELLRCCELPSSDHKVAVFLNQIMSAAEELHRHGFIHRDIKPSNILSRDDGTPVLIDFGLAAPMSDAVREKEALSVEEGMRLAVGTVGYSAPEQFSGLAAGAAADVHAIGAMIYACYRGEMPRCWRRIYLAATASNPKSRYQTVSDLRRAVAARHWRKMLAVGVVSVLIAGIAFVSLHMSQKWLHLPIKGPDANKKYSIRCQVQSKDRFIAHQVADGDLEPICPSDDELMSLLEDFFFEEYADQEDDGLLDYESLREDFISGDFEQDIADKFRSYIDDKVSDMDQSKQLGIVIRSVDVDPEGAFREDLEKVKQAPE